MEGSKLYLYSSPALIRSLLTNKPVLIREVSFGKRDQQHMHSGSNAATIPVLHREGALSKDYRNPVSSFLKKRTHFNKLCARQHAT